MNASDLKVWRRQDPEDNVVVLFLTIDKVRTKRQAFRAYFACTVPISSLACIYSRFYFYGSSSTFRGLVAMQWPWSKDKDDKPSVHWSDTLNATDWSHYRDPRNVIPVVILTSTALLSARLYRIYLRRIDQAGSIQPSFWRKRSLLGKVTSVGDADNFRLFHTPGGRLAGWGWLPWRKIPETNKELRDKTVRHFV